MSVNKQTAIKSNEVVLLPLYRGDHYSQESITCNYSYSTVSTTKLAPKKFRPEDGNGINTIYCFTNVVETSLYIYIFKGIKPMSSIFANFLSCTTCTNCFIISYLFCVTNTHFIKAFYNTTPNPKGQQENILSYIT